VSTIVDGDAPPTPVGPIRVGSMLFTLVDPHRGYEQRYHRWYERDHFDSNCLSGPGLFAGRRFVAPWALKTARFGDTSAWGQPPRAGSFLAAYWLEEGRHDSGTDRYVDELWDGREEQP
jgi:hypothetical protein